MSGMASEESKEVTLTPGGARRKELVHAVGPGEVVRFERPEAGVVLPREQVTAAPGARPAAADLVLTPGGYRPRSLVHQVGPRHALYAAGRRMLVVNLATDVMVDVPMAAVGPGHIPALGSGWIAYAYWNNGTGTPVSSLRTTWQVPPAPATEAKQTVFLFNGIQNYGANYGILQPVLQWGPSAAGGGSYWSVASWYVTSSGQAFHTPLVRVNPGDTLVGVLTLTNQSGTSFNYDCAFQGIAGTALPLQNIAELVWCTETLEAYQINQCSDYPDTAMTALRAISIQTGNSLPPLTWTPVNRVTDCGQKAVVVSNSPSHGEVDISYRP
jgi:hypothetical protein